VHLLRIQTALNRTPRPGFARISHLAARFTGSLIRQRLRPEDRRWVADLLTPAELVLWEQMPGIDQAESVAVARRACAKFGVATPLDCSLAAALLHDVGKAGAGLGPFGRSAATVVGWWVSDPVQWAASRPASDWRARVCTYLDHARVGADRIAAAGGRPEIVAWARHHHDPRSWQDEGFAVASGLSCAIARVLAQADGEAVGRPIRPESRDSE
jgi:hypothetical protein